MYANGTTIEAMLLLFAAVRGMDDHALSAWLGTTLNGLAALRGYSGPLEEERGPCGFAQAAAISGCDRVQLFAATRAVRIYQHRQCIGETRNASSLSALPA